MNNLTAANHPDFNHPTNTVVTDIPADAAAFDCLCSQDRIQASEQVRWLAEKSDSAYPPVPFPSRQMFEQVGADALTQLVERQHQRLLETDIAGLFPSDPKRFLNTVSKSVDFVVEAAGGPEHFSAKQGAMRMRERHFRTTIDERARDIWLRELYYAMQDVDFPTDWRPVYWLWMESFSIRMINRRTRMAAPNRYPYDNAATELSKALGWIPSQFVPPKSDRSDESQHGNSEASA
ncbi:hypothetical protein [Oceanobacter mangrovi]|uniref:globin domain-containing protein n=1 Tax=Oceanobacter mangrovi TaxID=2862510 RepID=UPI001C8EAAA6|nr:hypothetical protein [Oceanobacter mangrovi]